MDCDDKLEKLCHGTRFVDEDEYQALKKKYNNNVCIWLDRTKCDSSENIFSKMGNPNLKYLVSFG